MNSQNFKNSIPVEFFINFLDQICVKEENYYILNKTSYKKSIFFNLMNEFINELTKFYHTSKQFYVNRVLTYNHFLTIIRQICNDLNIKYNSKVYYIKSRYDITYYIYYDCSGNVVNV
jgi:hypothetical protein